MALRTSTRQGRIFKFHTNALAENALLIISLEGREAISQPYSFEFHLASKEKNIDVDSIFKEDAYLGIKQVTQLMGSSSRGVTATKIHGIIVEFEHSGDSGEWTFYRARLVPGIHKLTWNVRNRIFLNKTVPQMARNILHQHGFSEEDYEFLVESRDYPEREYMVQYGESDLAFLSRWLEHEGIFFFFKQEESGERIVFSDANQVFQNVSMAEDYPFMAIGDFDEKTPLPLDMLQDDGIHRIQLRQIRVPSEVSMDDYNYRHPDIDLHSSATVVEDGVGSVEMYGDHFKSVKEGKTLARIRAEEIACGQKIFSGVGDVRAFRAGALYTLRDHHVENYNRKYLLTEIIHRGEQTIQLAGMGGVQASYQNEFKSVSEDTSYRPKRITPKPRMKGPMNGTVVASSEDTTAPEIDDQGRYKVRLPFDHSGNAKSRATRYIRMAQPYASQSGGMHFPLPPGTEVLIVHIGGDPDRPIIQGAVPNPKTKSPVARGNNMMAGIQTSGGNQIAMDDTEGHERVMIRSGSGKSRIFIGSGSSEQITLKTGLYQTAADLYLSQTGLIGASMTSLRQVSLDVNRWTPLFQKAADVLGDPEKATLKETVSLSGGVLKTNETLAMHASLKLAGVLLGKLIMKEATEWFLKKNIMYGGSKTLGESAINTWEKGKWETDTHKQLEKFRTKIRKKTAFHNAPKAVEILTGGRSLFGGFGKITHINLKLPYDDPIKPRLWKFLGGKNLEDYKDGEGDIFLAAGDRAIRMFAGDNIQIDAKEVTTITSRDIISLSTRDYLIAIYGDAENKDENGIILAHTTTTAVKIHPEKIVVQSGNAGLKTEHDKDATLWSGKKISLMINEKCPWPKIEAPKEEDKSQLELEKGAMVLSAGTKAHIIGPNKSVIKMEKESLTITGPKELCSLVMKDDGTMEIKAKNLSIETKEDFTRTIKGSEKIKVGAFTIQAKDKFTVLADAVVSKKMTVS